MCILGKNRTIFQFVLFIVFKKKMEKKQKKFIKINDYELLTILGTGSFGKVKLAKNKKNGDYVCVKIMKKDSIIKAQQTDHIINQCQILSSISHPFIVNLIGVGQSPKLLFLFMQFVKGGELFSHLRQQGSFDSPKAAFYAAQITLIFQFLHSNDIIYRDLKPENILIAEDGYIKLADFGFAKVIQNRTFTLCGTPQYLAPEILLNQGHGKPVDWWTLGVIIYEMIAGIDPFNDDDPMIIYQNILKGKMKFPKYFDADAKSLVKHLLVSDLSARYGNLKNGVNDIKNHRFLNTINFTLLLQKKIPSPYYPKVRGLNDISNFANYDDSKSQDSATIPSINPFSDWSQ